jgi:Spy/CpxP family protein refolding chaperone
MVDAYVVSNLQESLGLTDEQFAKAIPLVKRLQTERRAYHLERARKLREMRRLLRQGGASERQVLDLLREVKTLDADGPAATRRNLEALDAVLTPLQQAKFRVLELEVEQRMRELVNRVRPRAGARAPRE